jgi:hypothetical protein
VRLAAEWRAELVSQGNELLLRLPSSEAATLLCSIRDNDSVLSDHLVAHFATDDDVRPNVHIAVYVKLAAVMELITGGAGDGIWPC